MRLNVIIAYKLFLRCKNIFFLYWVIFIG